MPEAVHGRNSPLREIFKYPIDLIVDALDKLGFTADQITLLGLLGNITSSVVVAKDVQKPTSDRRHWAANALILILPRLLDLLDGSLARKQGTSNPKLDVGIDRVSEITAMSAIAVTNPDAKNAAIANQLTSIGPSAAKALAETKGVMVPELDLSSYPIRVATATAAAVFPKQAKNILWLQTLANVYTTAKRLKLAVTSQDIPDLDQKAYQNSRNRLNLLLSLSLVSLATAIAVNQITKFPKHTGQK